jgi:phospho-N-acetylmuramoyl-pentapeptide-transferase
MVIFEGIRALIMFAMSFIVALFLTAIFVKLIERFNLKKVNIRDEKSAPIFYQFHKQKADTPTMGGVIIWGTVIGLALIFLIFQKLFDGFADYFNFVNRAETYLPLAAMFFAAIVGLIDDILGILRIGPKGGGLKVNHKLILYAVFGIIGAWWFYFKLGFDSLYIPFIGNVYIGFWYLVFFIFIIIATAFSVNETDGLDGLAGGTMLFSFAALTAVAFILQRYDLATMGAVLIGALLAFLWFNIYPARFFMGDTGSMALGITLGVMALLTNTALLLPFFALIPVIESISVIIQLINKKLFKRKVFLSTPIHHHFQALGWPESQITMRFWIISAVATSIGLVIFFLARFI